MGEYVAFGKEIGHRETSNRPVTHIADAADAEKAHFLVTAANAHSDFDYMAEADKTCSVVFNPLFVHRESLVRLLDRIAVEADRLNHVKKLLFRGKTPEELGLTMPAASQSLMVDFADPPVEDIDLLHGIIGVITEAGEMAEVLLHRLKTGSFDKVNAFEECGDVTWYLARQLRGLNTDFATMQRANIDKLHGRHGDAFDVFRDANRDLAAERTKLEDAAAPLFEQRGYASQAEFEAVEADIADLDKSLDRKRDAGHDPSGAIAAKLAAHHREQDADKLKAADTLDPYGEDDKPSTYGQPFDDRAPRHGVTGSNVGTDRVRRDPPAVEHHLRKPAGDCEGMDC